MRFGWLVAGVLAMISIGVSPLAAEAGTLYYTSINSGDTTFARYDPVLGGWHALSPYDTRTQMAASGDGSLYAYDDARDVIQRYRAQSDSWADFMPGPGVSNRWGDLEVTRSGRFLYTAFNGERLYYSGAEGKWGSVELPFRTAAFADYDPLTNRYVVGEYSTGRIHAIDLESFEITSYASGGGASEMRRMGSILDDAFYENSSSRGLRVWDLSDPASPPTWIEQPGNSAWLASAADREHDVLYAVDLFRGGFFALDALAGSTHFRVLASAPLLGNHSSLVYVPHNPEPATAALLFVGLVGLALCGRSRARPLRLKQKALPSHRLKPLSSRV